MAVISKIQLPNGNIYDIQDKTSGYLKSFTETDPVFSASAASGIKTSDITNWNNKQDKITESNKLAYSLISGTPTIPTVNNATLTIQKREIMFKHLQLIKAPMQRLISQCMRVISHPC